MVFYHRMNRRKHERYRITSSNVNISDPSTNTKISDAIINNCSVAGLCVFTTNNLVKDQIINVKQSGITKIQRAVVRWTQKLEDSYHKAGIELI